MTDVAIEAINRTAKKLKEMEAAFRIQAQSYDGINEGRATEYRVMADVYEDAYRILRENYP